MRTTALEPDVRLPEAIQSVRRPSPRDDSSGQGGNVVLRLGLLVFTLLVAASSAAAQNWSFDARRIALGGVGDARNPALELVDEQRGYGTIVLPFGLFQVLEDFSIYDPDDDNFDPVRAAEYVASPLHYTFNRNASDSGQQFINDIVNARINPNLNTYRGFQPANEFFGEGLAAPSWGWTPRFSEESNGAFQALYVGAGPYLSVMTDNQIDQEFIDLLASEVDVFVPNANFFITDDTIDQFAMAITGGYRARFPLPGRSTISGRDGMYIAANYNYLYGFHYDNFNMDIQFETDANGLLTVAPTTSPVVIERLTSDQGRGFALDFGIAFVVDRWDFGFAATGVANRIQWKQVQRERFVLSSLFDGGDFVETPLGPFDDQRVELPVNYAGNVAYHADQWSALADYSYGFQDNNFHGGLEYRLGLFELRGGGRFTRDTWHPSGGVGFDLSPGWSIDAGAFGTSTNVERRRHMALAVSFRLNPTNDLP